MRAVNLLPSDTHTRKRRLQGVDKWSVLAALTTVGVIVLVGGGFAVERARAASAQQQLEGMRSSLTRVAKAQAAAHAAQAKRPTLRIPDLPSIEQPWSDAVASALSTRFAWDGVLASLERVVPSNVTVTNITVAAPGANAATSAAATAVGTATNGTFTIAGSSFSQDSVAELLARLGLLHDLSQVTLTTSTTDPQTHVVNFQIQAQVTMPSSLSSGSTTTTSATTTSGGAA